MHGWPYNQFGVSTTLPRVQAPQLSINPEPSLEPDYSPTMSVAVLLLGGAGVLLLFHFVSPLVKFFKNYWRMKRITKDVPSPPSVPVLGHFLQIALRREDVYDTFVKWVQDVGSTAVLWICHVPLFVVMEPDDMEVILTSPKFMNKSFVYHSVRKIFGDGLATLKSKQYRRHRKAITPSLHLDILQDFVEVFNEEGKKFAEKLCSLADSESVFDVKPLCGYCANSAVCKTVLSAGVAEGQVDRENFVNSLNYAQEYLMLRIWRPYYLSDWLFSLSSHYAKYTEMMSCIDGFVKTVLGIKMAQHARGENAFPSRRRKAFLDHMLSSAEGSVLSEEELFAEAKTMTVVGSGSSMDALAFMCYVLSIRQDMQLKVQQEVDEIFEGDDDRPVMFTDLPHLDFTERYIKEVLRYFPVVPIFARNCPEDIKLPSGYTAPKGCQIAFFLQAVHKSPKFFPEPDKFDPDRWLPENSRNRHPFSFIPFSAGPRNCIGQRYAMMFMKTVLTNLVRRVSFLPAPNAPTRLEDVPLKMDLTLSVRNQFLVRVERRVPKACAVSMAG